jgi:hypothetical protein
MKLSKLIKAEERKMAGKSASKCFSFSEEGKRKLRVNEVKNKYPFSCVKYVTIIQTGNEK